MGVLHADYHPTLRCKKEWLATTRVLGQVNTLLKVPSSLKKTILDRPDILEVAESGRGGEEDN